MHLFFRHSNLLIQIFRLSLHLPTQPSFNRWTGIKTQASGRGRKIAQKQTQNGLDNSDGIAHNSTEDNLKDAIKDQSSELDNSVMNTKIEVSGEISDTLPNGGSKEIEKITDNQETKRGRKRGKINIDENGTIVGKDKNLKPPASIDPVPKRGRRKANDVNSAETVSSSEKLGNVTEHITEKVDESELNGEVKSELNQETKRGRKRGKVNVGEKTIVGKDKDLEPPASIDPVPKHRRRKANDVNSAEIVDSSEKLENVTEHLTKKVDESELNGEVESELNCALASNEPMETEESTEKNDVENCKPEGEETDTVSNSKDLNEDFKHVPKTEVVAKRGRKKADIKESSSAVSKSEDPSNSETPSQKTPADDKNEETIENPGEKEQKTVKSKSGSKASKSSAIKVSTEITNLTETTKNTRTGRNKKQTEVSAVKETLGVGRKRKNAENEPLVKEIKKNKSKSEFEHSDIVDKTRALKVSLERSKSIDNLLVEQTEKYKEVGKTGKGSASKPAAKGKRAKADNSDGSDSGAKPAKIPKETKGQSKKDKMPDVTLQNFDNTSTSRSGKPWNLKISSWNVNGVRAWLEKDGLAYLKHESPDIMCLQETKCSDNNLPEEIVNVAGYHSYFLAAEKEGYSGVGLLTKEKPISVKYGIGIDEHSDEGRTITAEYENFYLVTAYVPNAGKKLVRLDYRQQWDKDFRSYLKNLDGDKPVILCGDLNVAHEEIDIANPKTNKKNAGFTKEEREGFSVLLSEGFVDTFRHLYPDQKGAYTFWTYMMNARAKNVGWRLDYFVLSKRLIDNLCDNVIRKDVFGSDHCPITLFLSF